MNIGMTVGNLTRDPELRRTQKDVSVCEFTVASNRGYEEGADYIHVIAWRKQAENCARYLKKGRKVAVRGTWRQRYYEDRNGQRREVWELHADEVEFMAGQKDAEDTRDMSPAQEPDIFDMPF